MLSASSLLVQLLRCEANGTSDNSKAKEDRSRNEGIHRLNSIDSNFVVYSKMARPAERGSDIMM